MDEPNTIVLAVSQLVGGPLHPARKSLIGEGGLDLIMGGVAFIPGGGWVVSATYFGLAGMAISANGTGSTELIQLYLHG